jgi:outer membrane protein OmpA-like peptidoglycan-associated protein
VVLRSTDDGALVVAPTTFEPGSATLGWAAARDLARTGRALRDLGATRLRVMTFRDDGPPGDDLASRRAVALARALARGGYPPGAIALEVTLSSGAQGAGRILVAGRCLNACAVPATPPRR